MREGPNPFKTINQYQNARKSKKILSSTATAHECLQKALKYYLLRKLTRVHNDDRLLIAAPTHKYPKWSWTFI